MFKDGDLVRIKDTPHIRGWGKDGGKFIGNTFIINFREDDKHFKEQWGMGEIPSAICDQSNTYAINYYINDLELVNPSYEIY